MLTAFTRHADGPTKMLENLDAVSDAWVGEQTVLWIDLAAPSEEDVRGVAGIVGLEDDVVEDCLHGEQRPRIDEFDDCFFIVVYGMLGSDENDEIAPRKLAAVVGRRFLITVHREPLRTIGELRSRYMKHPSQALGHGVDFVFFTILDRMVDVYMYVAERYEERLDALEEQSLQPAVTDAILPQLVDLRRDLLELRRMAASELELLAPLARGEFEYVSEYLAERFRHVQDHLRHVVEQVEAHRELLNSIRDNYHAVIANRMNGIMKTLTMFATVLLPLSLVAGVYGMNLQLWPPTDHPMGFWLVLGVMVVIGTAAVIFFRSRKWL
jgi:magnesium transporter